MTANKASFFDGRVTKILPLPPETISWNISGTYARTNVLDRDKPDLRRKHSDTTLRLGRILLISSGLNVDFYPLLNTLTTWSERQVSLSFNYNTYSLPSCYISSCQVEVKQWKNGKPVHAEVEMELLEAYLKPKAKTALPPNKITKREQIKKQGVVEKKLKVPSNALAIGLSKEYQVAVSDVSLVSLSSGKDIIEIPYDEFIERLT